MGQVTAQPATFSDNDAIEIIFNAAEGSKGLKGYTGNDVYAHTGVITNKSVNNQDWKYAPTWLDNSEKYKLTRIEGDRWKLTISPSVRSYYGVPAGEEILKLAFVFRNGNGSKEGKTEAGGDIFLGLNEELFVPTAPINKAKPSGIIDGINYIDDHTVTFLLFAPNKQHVHLLGDFNNWQKDNDYQLYKDGDYWWYTLTGLERQKEYGFQYLIDNNFKIGDAYCEKILDPWNDSYIPESVYPNLKPYPKETDDVVSLFQTDAPKMNWLDIDYALPAKEELRIYELLLRDFTEEGTVKAAMQKLDYLEELGVNAIELMPIQEFDGNDSWGYNPCFYFAPDKSYGTADDFKLFIQAAHQRGMAVILDVVFNHATGLHPFARLYWENNATSKENPWFNQEAPHPYNVFNDFNHEYVGTRNYFKRVLTHWIQEYQIDGFRFDLTKGFTQNKSTESTASRYDASRVAILKDYNSHIKSVKSGIHVILEHFCDMQEELELAEAGMMLWNNVNHAYSQSVGGWNSNSDLSWGCYTRRGWDIPGIISFAESHDEERLMYNATTYGNWNIKGNTPLALQRAGLAAAFISCTPGPIMMWQFGELGYDYSINYNDRTGRKPIKWEYFEQSERKALYDTYAALWNFRGQHSELFAAPDAIEMMTTTGDWPVGRAIRLKHKEMDMVLLGNFLNTATNIKAGFTATGTWRELFSDEQLTVSSSDYNQAITLQPHSFKLYYLDKTSGNESIATQRPVSWSYDSESNRLTVESDASIQAVSLIGINGALYSQWQGAGQYDLTPFAPGTYILRITTADTLYSEKFIR